MVIGNAVLVPVVLFYLLLDWPQAGGAGALGADPAAPGSPADGFLDECDAVLGQYLRGQLLVMLVLAACTTPSGWRCSASTSRCRVGVFTGLAMFIPYLGFGLGLLLALLAALLQFASWYGLSRWRWSTASARWSRLRC